MGMNGRTRARRTRFALVHLAIGLLATALLGTLPHLFATDRVGARGGLPKRGWATPVPKSWPDRPVPSVTTQDGAVVGQATTHWHDGLLHDRANYQLTFLDTRDPQTLHYTVQSAGFPLRASTVSAGWEQAPSGAWTPIPGSWRQGIALQGVAARPGALGRRLPLRWDGPRLALNIVVFGAVSGTAALLWTRAMHARRSCRGHCPECGYASGSAPDVPCPECGAVDR